MVNQPGQPEHASNQLSFHKYQHKLPKTKGTWVFLLYLRSTQEALRLPGIT